MIKHTVLLLNDSTSDGLWKFTFVNAFSLPLSANTPEIYSSMPLSYWRNTKFSLEESETKFWIQSTTFYYVQKKKIFPHYSALYLLVLVPDLVLSQVFWDAGPWIIMSLKHNN